MAFRLPRLQRDVAIADPKTGRPTALHQRWWQSLAETIETQETFQDSTINRIRRLLSHTTPTTILSATDNGASCTITVLDHTRVYADATTLAISGGATAGLASDTWYACYYDDETLADATPSFVFTTALETAQAAVAEGRHFCGLIRTPVAGSGQTVESGGAYPAGAANVGGELA
jgi:hypothetical protein